MTVNKIDMKSSAVISPCAKYRYDLRRIWDHRKKLVLFIGLNPSTADAAKDDNTSRVCMNYAKRWGYGGLVLANLFAYRATDPSFLRSCDDPIGPGNDQWIMRAKDEASLVICAWGSGGNYMDRNRVVLGYVQNPFCLSKLKDGSPGHPLYKPASLKPQRY